jgi:hypothetical protein
LIDTLVLLEVKELGLCKQHGNNVTLNWC